MIIVNCLPVFLASFNYVTMVFLLAVVGGWVFTLMRR